MRSEISAFLEEVDDLASLLSTLPDAAWSHKTQFKNWTINDVVLHLFATDQLGRLVLASPNEYAGLRAGIRERRQSGLSMIEETQERIKGLRGRRLLEDWQEQARTLAQLLDQRDPKSRVEWSGPSMSARTFATARQMETWAHGSEIYDCLTLKRTEHDRIRNIVELGVRTFGFSFQNRGLDLPGSLPEVELQAPSGQTWRWGSAADSESIRGQAVDFCAVVTQTRNVQDTALEVKGTVARSWMAIAQCFAGAPVSPPESGSRHPASTNPFENIVP